MGLSHLEKHVAEEINSKRPVLLLVSGSPCWTQKYWDRFPREAQGTLVPAGVVCVPTLRDAALLRSLRLPLVCSQVLGGIRLTPGWVSTCSVSATETSHLSFQLQPIESNRHFRILSHEASMYVIRAKDRTPHKPK